MLILAWSVVLLLLIDIAVSLTVMATYRTTETAKSPGVRFGWITLILATAGATGFTLWTLAVWGSLDETNPLFIISFMIPAFILCLSVVWMLGVRYERRFPADLQAKALGHESIVTEMTPAPGGTYGNTEPSFFEADAGGTVAHVHPENLSGKRQANSGL